MAKRIKILHIITDTDVGGAERMLEALIRHTDRNTFDPEVLSLLPVQGVGEVIREMGVPVDSAGMNSGLPSPARLRAVYRWIRRRRPAVVQTWMYHADLIGGLAARLAGVPVIWGIHQSNLSPEVNTRNTMLSARICRRLSFHVPHHIVCCSFASERTHSAFGYDAEKMRVIHNGFELPATGPASKGPLEPADKQGRELRRELGIRDEDFVIGMVARFDPQKDHATFIEAARRMLNSRQGLKTARGKGDAGITAESRRRSIHFLLCGENVEWENPDFAALFSSGRKGEPGRSFHLLGRRSDMDRVYGAMDILSTSSIGEGLPLVVGEAMARSVPCVVTDVGDSAYVVGDTGWVVPPSDPDALAARWRACTDINASEVRRMGTAARSRIEKVLNIETAVGSYHELYTDVYRTTYGEAAVE